MQIDSAVLEWVMDLVSDPVGFSSVILTLALVVLYYRQQDILELDQTPQLKIEGYRGGLDDRDSNTLELDLSNVGNGVAHSPEIEVIPEISHKNIEGIEHRTRLKRERVSEYRWFTVDEAYLNPEESHITFFSYISIRWRDSDPENESTKHSSTIGSAAEQFLEKGVDSIRLKFNLYYENPMGEEISDEFFDKMVPLSEYMDLHEIFHRSLDYDRYFDLAEIYDDPFSVRSVASSPVGMSYFEEDYDDLIDPEDVFDMDANHKIPIADSENDEYREYNITERTAKTFLKYRPGKVVFDGDAGTGLIWDSEEVRTGDRTKAQFLFEVFSESFDVDYEERNYDS